METTEVVRALEEQVRGAAKTFEKFLTHLSALEEKANRLQGIAREVDELTRNRDILSASVANLVAHKSELEREFAALRARLG